MATERWPRICAPIPLAAALLTWPALWNGYPLVFSDTGTYLSQAIEHYLGWDRPIFYSLFMLPLHLTLTTWPVVAAQALLTAHTLHLVLRTLLPGRSPWWLIPLVAFLAVTTTLPWLVSQLMPDLFTPLLVLVLSLLVLVPDRCSRRERIWLVLFAAFMIAAHLSNVPLAAGLVMAGLVPAITTGTRPGRDGRDKPGHSGVALAPLLLAVAALIAMNLVAFGRASPSPFGNVFLLARVIYDGPGMDVMRRDSPGSGWLLCPYLDQFPPIADDFLWRADSPLALAGGAKRISAEADAIIGAALIAEPDRELRAFAGNSVQQLVGFASGDGLEAWPSTVTQAIERDFPPAERAAYTSARQTRGELAMPDWLRAVHMATALLGVLGCGLLAVRSPRSPIGSFAIAALLAVLGNAVITGGLSGPHDRYQSRIMCLPPLIALLGLPLVIRPHP